LAGLLVCARGAARDALEPVDMPPGEVLDESQVAKPAMCTNRQTTRKRSP